MGTAHCDQCQHQLFTSFLAFKRLLNVKIVEYIELYAYGCMPLNACSSYVNWVIIVITPVGNDLAIQDGDLSLFSIPVSHTTQGRKWAEGCLPEGPECSGCIAFEMDADAERDQAVDVRMVGSCPQDQLHWRLAHGLILVHVYRVRLSGSLFLLYIFWCTFGTPSFERRPRLRSQVR